MMKYRGSVVVKVKRCMPSKDAIRKKAWRAENPKASWASYARRDAKNRAVKKGVPFELTTAYIKTLMNDTCPIFGTDFNYGKNKGIQPTSPTLDRIVPELGYVEGNVVIISAQANHIKSAYTSKEIYLVADWLYEIEKGRK